MPDHYKSKLVQAYEQLSDEEAVDGQVQSNLKKQFMHDVPVLRPLGEIWAEEGVAKVDVTRLPNRMPALGDRRFMKMYRNSPSTFRSTAIRASLASRHRSSAVRPCLAKLLATSCADVLDGDARAGPSGKHRQYHTSG